MRELSIIIPARNEMFLARTVRDLLKNIRADTEIIVALDGKWASPPLPKDDRLKVIYFPESIGQRACMNRMVAMSRAKYIMKVDAHCSFDEGFDRIMIDDMEDDVTMLPVMKNLHAFDWVCNVCGSRHYQSPTPKKCWNDECTNTDRSLFHRDIVWKAKPSPNSTAYRFDREMKFQYWGGLKARQVGDLVETLSIQGSCFMLTRDKYIELGIADEAHGSWGQQGTEVACKTWLSGGRVLVNKKTWYAHLFRTQGKDFGFPYPNPGVGKARAFSRDLWLNDKWDKAIHPLSWLIARFAPVPDWEGYISPDDPKASDWGVLYYTDNQLDPDIMKKCQRQLGKVAGDHPLVSVSLQPLDFGDNIVLPLERGYITMFQQILAGLKRLNTEFVFFAEHDVLYHASHFYFRPEKDDVYYYNVNVWKVRMSDGHGLYHAPQQVSGLVANRQLLLQHYEKRLQLIQENGFSRRMGFEPGTHGRPERVDDYEAESFESDRPNIDLRHEGNATSSRWTKEEFRNKRFTVPWIESDNIPGWGTFDHFWRRI